MPELPDIAAYIGALESRIVRQPLVRVRLANVFLLRTVQPPTTDVEGRTVRELRRIGKRIAIGVDGDLWLVLHLMIAGRLHWRPAGAKLSGRQNLAAFDFPGGSLVLTEAGTKRRASLHVLSGEEALRAIDPGGIDVFASDLALFRATLSAENRTLKRALTDPRLLSGIGNAYSDEILHAAQLSPIALTHKLEPGEWKRLFDATRNTLRLWMDRLCCRRRGWISRKGDCVSRGHGSSRPLSKTLPAMWRKNPAYSLRRQRDELLRALSDRRKSSSGPRPLAAIGFGLASHARRTRGPHAPLATMNASGTTNCYISQFKGKTARRRGRFYRFSRRFHFTLAWSDFPSGLSLSPGQVPRRSFSFRVTRRFVH